MIEILQLSALNDAPRNANVMDEAKIAALTDELVALREHGKTWRQPPLIRPIDKDGEYSYEIVDGHHRVRAARAAGWTEVPCVVAEMTDAEALLAGIQMNRLRGELSLGVVGEIFAGLISDGADLAALVSTGFSQAEVDNLIESAAHNPDDDIPIEMERAPAPEPDSSLDSWDLPILFGNRADRDRARRTLRRLAGKGNELAVGLLRLIDNEQGEGELDALLEASQLMLENCDDAATGEERDALTALGKAVAKITKRRGRKEKRS